MKLTYHPQHNIAYISLRDAPAEVETIHVSDEVNIDVAPDGVVYGIELLNANSQLTAADGGELIVINEASGESSRIKLPV